MTEKTKETAAQQRMREFREAQDVLAAARERAKGKPHLADDDE